VSERRRPPRGAVVGALVVLGALLVVVLFGGPGRREGPPLDPRSDLPDGTSAMVSLLDRVGADVVLSGGLPDRDDDVALLLVDRLAPDDRATLERWVEDGGTLVVTDPYSPFAPGRATRVRTDEVLRRGTCTIAALDDVEQIDPGDAWLFERAGSDGSCGGVQSRGWYVWATAVGQGQLVAAGSPWFLTNERLGEEDNAMLAVALLAPAEGTRVRLVDAPIPAAAGDKTLGDLVPRGLVRALFQLAAAFVLYAIWRAIRLGQPVREQLPVEVAGSELVTATGQLIARTQAHADAAQILRTQARRRVARRFGLPADTPPDRLAAEVANRTGLPAEDVRAALDDRPVTSEDQLLALTRSIATLDQEVPR